MATVKKGMLTATGEWWRHLRKKKRTFWKAERQAAKESVRGESFEQSRASSNIENKNE